MSTRPAFPCEIKQLPDHLQVAAARKAIEINPANAPNLHPRKGAAVLPPSELAAITSRCWSPSGVRLTVGFLENTPASLQKKILDHMNLWGRDGNVAFTLAGSDSQVRITFAQPGYWSYFGMDILQIPAGEATMCLQDFSLSTSDAEFLRVVPHETGHTLGFLHEHLRAELIARLDPTKTIAYFESEYNWTEDMVRYNVLTPPDPRDLTTLSPADEQSVMCYDLPGSITRDGRPILGGNTIGPFDRSGVAKLYPKSAPPPPPPPPGGPADVKAWFQSIVGEANRNAKYPTDRRMLALLKGANDKISNPGGAAQ